MEAAENPTDVQELEGQNAEIPGTFDDDVSTPEPEIETLESDAGTEESELSLSEAASILGLEENDLDVEDGRVILKTKIDGREGRLNFAELKTAYQKQGHLDNLTRDATAKLNDLKQQEADLQKKSTEKLQTLEDATKLALADLYEDAKKVNWAELRQEDPAEYAIQTQELKAKESKFIDRLKRIGQERVTQTETARNKFAQEQEHKLISALPEWANLETAAKELGDIRDYATTQGFTPEETAMMIDHRFILMARKAKLYDDLQNKSAEVDKQVRKVAKVSKPGTAGKKAAPKSDADYFYN